MIQKPGDGNRANINSFYYLVFLMEIVHYHFCLRKQHNRYTRKRQE